MRLSLPKIYPITDRELSGLSHAEQVAKFIDGGATLIQIRDKRAPSGELYRDAAESIRIAHAAGARVLINDRVDIALMTGADGVHLGQEDLPAAAARRILGDGAIIGVSTHSLEQVTEALTDRSASYLAFGPIFPTSTKDKPDPPVGLDGLERIREMVGDVSLVAIGGIKRHNLASVLAAGADSAAVISEFFITGSDITTQFRKLLDIAEATNNVVIS